MLRVVVRSNALRTLSNRAAYISTSARLQAQLNAPLDIDPSLQALLQDVDLSLARHKARLADPNGHAGPESSSAAPGMRNPRELEVFGDLELDNATLDYDDLEGLDFEHDTHETRKSPAANFGSQHIGAVILPLELHNAITRLIEGADKGLLKLDARRLFLGPSEDPAKPNKEQWDIDYDVRYKSHKQSARHAERDGTAFASVALPAHFSAILAVFTHIAHRLGPEWKPDRVIDWHAGTGSGLWAAVTAFQQSGVNFDRNADPDLTKSSLSSYTAIDRRDSLVQIGKRLLEGVDLGDVQVEWKKMLSSSLLSPSSSPSPTSEEAAKLSNAEASETPKVSDASPAEAKPETPETQESTHEHSQPKQETIALSAFALSSLPSALARKQLVKEIWESGADTIVLIDHNNIEGFEHIAQARELLLKLGRKEIERAEAEKAEAEAGVEGQETSATQESAPVHEGTASQQDSSASETPAASTTQSNQPTQAVQATPSGPLGSYALAPCPHDGVCPLYRPQSKAHKLICGFSQRIQRPAFVRKTKASGVGHEDIGYSYVVIRRGARPGLPADEVAGTDALDFMKRGRVGLVGKRDEERRMERAEAALGPKEIEELEAGTDAVSAEGTEVTEKTSSAEYAADLQASSRSSSSIASTGTTGVTGTTSLEDALRLEANRWPRLIFPPLKRSGHIILDVCSPTGKILRSTIPKSQGKQPYYDARKSDWGDLFPHAPKNKPVERHIPEDKKSKDKGKGGGEHQAKGTDIGKRGVRMGKEDTKERPGYGAMSEGRQKGKKETRKARGLKTKYDPGDEDDD